MKPQETILVVEDETSLRKFMRLALQDNGYKVLLAESGAEAMVLAQDHRGPIHLLVTDYILMGSMDGLELAQSLKQKRRELAVLCTSGYAVENSWGVREGSQDEYLDSFLPKPFTPRQLLRSVEACLQHAG